MEKIPNRVVVEVPNKSNNCTIDCHKAGPGKYVEEKKNSICLDVE